MQASLVCALEKGGGHLTEHKNLTGMKASSPETLPLKPQRTRSLPLTKIKIPGRVKNRLCCGKIKLKGKASLERRLNGLRLPVSIRLTQNDILIYRKTC